MTTCGELKPMTEGIVPIALGEYEARMAKARRLMVESGIEAIYIEGGSSMRYFTGVQWGLSERMTAVVIPAKGEMVYICPTFEEERLRNAMLLAGAVRTWEEHESPYERVAQIFADLGVANGTIGMEQRVRFFLFDGIREAAPGAKYVSADPVTVPCRAEKSAAEIALLQRAMDITSAAYQHVIPMLREGITRAECMAAASAAHRELGAAGAIDFQFAEATALPHGGAAHQVLKEGDVVLMDASCSVEGYRSDISRTLVFGQPTPYQRDIWELEKAAQAAGFAAAQPGAPCDAVDAAARKVIVDAGFGPDYLVPGLPHRTGHGIGLDIHEPENMVKGNKTPLAPGMCFTDEPMIVTDRGFGVRLEDCVFITEDGPRWFTQPSPAIDQPCV